MSYHALNGMKLDKEQLRTINRRTMGTTHARTLSIASFISDSEVKIGRRASMFDMPSFINSDYEFFDQFGDGSTPKPPARKRSLSMEIPRSVHTGDHHGKPDVKAVRKPAAISLPKNERLVTFLQDEIHVKGMMMRLAAFIHAISNDKDQQRVHGEYYNNIYLGKRMFGPAKKQKFLSTITGGMERRFEFLDSQVNHQSFTHLWSDRNLTKCRNPQVSCIDDSRVQLRSDDDGETSFIHANWVRGGPLFNEFIVTQAPMETTVEDFWRMVWQEKVPYIFMLISRKQPERCVRYWPKEQDGLLRFTEMNVRHCGVDEERDPLFRVTHIEVVHDNGQTLRLEHWQADMNNTNNLEAPLRLLHLARNSSKPVIVHDCLGISRAGCLVTIEAAIASLIRGPTYKHTIQKAVQFVRSQRAFCIETPMQYIYVHRCVAHFFEGIIGKIPLFDSDYRQWLERRAGRMFLDFNEPLPGHLMLSPRVDPDLLKQVRKPPRGNERCETASGMGELPLPLHSAEAGRIAARRRILPNKYPAGKKY